MSWNIPATNGSKNNNLLDKLYMITCQQTAPTPHAWGLQQTITCQHWRHKYGEVQLSEMQETRSPCSGCEAIVPWEGLLLKWGFHWNWDAFQSVTCVVFWNETLIWAWCLAWEESLGKSSCFRVFTLGLCSVYNLGLICSFFNLLMIWIYNFLNMSAKKLALILFSWRHRLFLCYARAPSLKIAWSVLEFAKKFHLCWYMGADSGHCWRCMFPPCFARASHEPRAILGKESSLQTIGTACPRHIFLEGAKSLALIWIIGMACVVMIS